jgi:SAM-dependent methyltransferase
MSQAKQAGVSGRDHYDSLYQKQLANEAEWLDRTANHKADSIEYLLRKNGIPCGTMLELGCGTGSVIRECQRRGLSKSFIAVDYSESAIEYLREHSAGIETHVADVTDPAFVFDEPVDVVVLSHVIEHLERPHPFLKSLQKIKFRYLIAEVPLDDLLMGRLSALAKEDRTQNTAGHVQFFTASSFRRLLRASDFEVMDSRRYLQLLDLSTIRFVCQKNRSSYLIYLKMVVGRYLRLATGPLWARIFSANYAVLSRPSPGSVREACDPTTDR